ncbi:MAG: ankyrin repeat domain-containing protein [Deltaproteobacteria bacterium]|nr:ankyrin repeat domain-containing protein [Deltaproteobacteria bacterium]
MTNAFAPAEREALADARLAVFRDRIILSAQPPIDPIDLGRIERRCAGPIPRALTDLWHTCFGGRLAYDLRVNFDGHEARFSFTELFYPDSDGYMDLWGWIEHEESLEKEAAHAAGRPASATLNALPFGGFEYLERLYVLTSPGRQGGAIVAWRQGLPPAWNFDLNADAATRVADDVYALFDQLHLELDPWSVEHSNEPTGIEMIDAIDGLATRGTAGKSAAEKLRSLVRGCVLDWRAALADGTLVQRRLLRNIALEHAARANDVELCRRLKAEGCSLHERVSGGATMLEHALAAGSLQVAHFLIAEGAPVDRALRYGAHIIDVSLARDFLSRGAIPDEAAIFAATRDGDPDVAWMMLDHATIDVSSLQLAITARKRATDAEHAAKQIDAGKLASNLTSTELRRRAARLNALAARVDPTLRPGT